MALAEESDTHPRYLGVIERPGTPLDLGQRGPAAEGFAAAAAGEDRVASASRPDFAAGAVAVLLGEGHEGKVYELSGDHAWDFNELAGTIASMIGRPVTYQPVDALALIEILKGAGM